MCDSPCSCRLCCGLHHALRRSLSVVAGCLSNGRLRQQWACISVGTGCLGNGRLRRQWACISVGTGCLCNGWLRQQWACISVGVGCLGNGGRPSPTEHVRPSARGSFGIAIFSVPLGYPKRSVPAIPWAGPLSKSHSVSSPALSRLQLPVHQGTWKGTPCGERWVGPVAASSAAGFARQRYCLASRVFFILGNFPVLRATNISLEMQLRLTSLRIQRELQSWVVLTAPC